MPRMKVTKVLLTVLFSLFLPQVAISTDAFSICSSQLDDAGTCLVNRNCLFALGGTCSTLDSNNNVDGCAAANDLFCRDFSCCPECHDLLERYYECFFAASGFPCDFDCDGSGSGGGRSNSNGLSNSGGLGSNRVGLMTLLLLSIASAGSFFM